ncbi:ABC transporter ATP-binding protein [uncultured Gemella sp.]|uniref:ABC transporter ATP-binding protein n=1 Tax=uncultured Gemella sp. TaxID=254352 RepID=UPI0028D3CFC8|nr:ABC transporter ATP-binding protein [uncultured Gemella sp.]
MTNSEKNKDMLSNDGLNNNRKTSEDYANLLEKIRKQLDIENSSTYTRKSYSEQESNEQTVVMPVVTEEVNDEYAETVVLDRNELIQAVEKETVPEEVKKEEKAPEKSVVLEVLGLKKRIGLKTIVEDITFDMREGEIIGLLGPNGSGKTTIMRMIVGLTKISKGDVYCFEKPLGLGKNAMLKEVGSMIETPEFYNYMSGWSNLKQIARVCGKKVTRARMKELVEFVGLSKVIRKKVKTYSLGMRQRLGLAQALLNDPKILILDEPVNGLDPQGVQDFRNKLKEIAATGVSILISSHLLDEIEKLCDRVIVIEKGKIIADDKLEHLISEEVVKTLIATHDVEKSEMLVRELGIRYELTKEGFVFKNLSREEKSRIISYLVNNNVELDTVRELHTSLEDRFLQITGGERK